jgi:hypothetical protein
LENIIKGKLEEKRRMKEKIRRRSEKMLKNLQKEN